MKAAPRSTPTLRELQRQMAKLIASGDRPDALRPEVTDLCALVAGPERGTVVDRLQVYVGGYPARVLEALAETFPALAHVLGEGAFAHLSHRYVEAVPLNSYNLNDAGADLWRFLQGDRLTADLPFLPDLAQLEWRVARAFHAFEQAALDPTKFAESMDDWERVVLRFQPWVAVVMSEWPIREIWESRETPVDEIDIDLRNRPDRVLVRRASHAVVCESVDGAEAESLAALLDGQTLGAVVAMLTARGLDPAAVSACFARWMALRMIVGGVVSGHVGC